MTSSWRKWTSQEIEALHSLWGKQSSEQIGQRIGRSQVAVEIKASQLNLTYDTRLKPFWDMAIHEEDRKAIAWTIASEGTIGVRIQHRQGNGYRGYDPYVAVGNTDPQFLEAFLALVGAGRIYPHPEKRPNYRPSAHWVLNRNIECLKLLETVSSYLPIKRRQAELVIELCRLKLQEGRGFRSPSAHRQAEIYSEVRALNRRGPKGGDTNAKESET